jgi:hypothetical protein
MMPSRNKYVTKAIRNFHQAGWFLNESFLRWNNESGCPLIAQSLLTWRFHVAVSDESKENAINEPVE